MSRRRTGTDNANTAWKILGGIAGLVAGIIAAPFLNEILGLMPGPTSWLGWVIGPPAGIFVGVLLLPAWIENRKS